MNERINLQDLVTLLSEKADITKKDAETFLREYFEVINEELVKDGMLKVKDLGAFKLLQVEDRESIDVTTGERVLIPAHYKVTFTPDKKLAETVNEPFAYFETTEIEENSGLDDLKLLSEEDATEEFEPTFDESEPVIQTESASEEKDETFHPETETQEEPLPEETPPAEVSPTVEEPSVEEDSLTVEKEPSVEEKPLFEKEPSVTEEPETSSAKHDECRHCHYIKRYHTYREEYYKTRKKLKRSRITIAILTALLVAALGFIAYIVYFEHINPFRNISRLVSVSEKESYRVDISKEVIKRLDDSLPVVGNLVKKQVSEKAATAKTPETPAPAKVSATQPTPPEKAGESKQIIIAPGQRLTTIAQKEYGNKAFWIYIYLENKAIIQNPNSLPLGAKITIPPAEKYGINSNDPASVQKAKDEAMKHP